MIFLNGDALGGERALAGMAALVIAVILNSACLVGLKRIGDDSPPTATTVGVLLSHVCGILADHGRQAARHHPPHERPPRLHISTCSARRSGSPCMLIKHLKATKVALITLITPVVALLLGNMLNDEIIGPASGWGTGLILLGLALPSAEVTDSLLRG